MIHRLVYLSCDGDGCGDATGEYDATSIREARALARGLGYTHTPDGRDLCEHCTEKERNRDRSDS